MTNKEFFEWERKSRDTIDFKRCYADVADGDIVTGLLLSQIIYWHLPDKNDEDKRRVEIDGELWLRKARDEWWEECRISPKQFDRAIKKLEHKGLVTTKNFTHQGRLTKHLKLNISTLVKKLEETEGKDTSPKGKRQSPKRETSLPETGNVDSQKGKCGQDEKSRQPRSNKEENSQNTTETTSETTSETTTGTPQPEKKSGRHQTGSQTGTGSQVVDVGQKKEELKNLKEKFSLTDQAVSRHKKQYNAGDTKKFNRFSVRSGHSNDGPALRAAIELYDEGGIDNQFMLDFIEHEWQLWDFSRTNDTDSVKGMLVLECLYVAPTITHFSLLTEEQKQKELKKGQKKPEGWTQEEVEAKLNRELSYLEVNNFMNGDGSFDGKGILRREGLTT